MFVQEPSRYCSDWLYSFGKHCGTGDLEDDYFEQKTKKKRIKPHLQPLDLQGEFIIN